jgi:hypothetical protein
MKSLVVIFQDVGRVSTQRSFTRVLYWRDRSFFFAHTRFISILTLGIRAIQLCTVQLRQIQLCRLIHRAAKSYSVVSELTTDASTTEFQQWCEWGWRKECQWGVQIA